jgi:hypothetical protein
MFNRRFLTASTIVTMTLAGVVLIRASLSAPGGVIYDCYDTANGGLRVIDNSVSTCKPQETQLIWSQIGPQGPIGPPGPL